MPKSWDKFGKRLIKLPNISDGSFPSQKSGDNPIILAHVPIFMSSLQQPPPPSQLKNNDPDNEDDGGVTLQATCYCCC